MFITSAAVVEQSPFVEIYESIKSMEWSKRLNLISSNVRNFAHMDILVRRTGWQDLATLASSKRSCTMIIFLCRYLSKLWANFGLFFRLLGKFLANLGYFLHFWANFVQLGTFLANLGCLYPLGQISRQLGLFFYTFGQILSQLVFSCWAIFHSIKWPKIIFFWKFGHPDASVECNRARVKKSPKNFYERCKTFFFLEEAIFFRVYF